MIFITTSNGVYVLKAGSKQPQVVMTRKHTRGLFKKKSLGYFGICHHQDSGKILVASREKLGSKVIDKPSPDCKLLAIDPVTLGYEVIGIVMGVHDVHQITSNGSLVFLTDTGLNRIHVYDLAQQKTIRILNIGAQRSDIHHLNAVYASTDTLMIGMNNRGTQESAVLSISLDKIRDATDFEIDGLLLGETQVLTGIRHTHDLEPYGDDFLCCASHAGFVFRLSDLQPIITINSWVRGLCADEKGLWVGSSPLASRKERHSEKLDGCVYLYSHQDFTRLETYPLQGSGQVNDLLASPSN